MTFPDRHYERAQDRHIECEGPTANPETCLVCARNKRIKERDD